MFPARDFSTDPRGGAIRRHHVDPSVINKAIQAAVRRVGLTKRINAHTFRHYLPPTCSSAALTSARFKPCWDITIWPPPGSTPTSCSKAAMALPALLTTSVCDRRCGGRQSASSDAPRFAGSTGCNGPQTATCSFVLVPRGRGSPGADEETVWNRDGRGRTTAFAFCMTPPWGAPLAGSRMVKGSEREKHAQAIMAV